MKIFNTNKIETHAEEAANLLKATRLEKGLKIEEAAKMTEINIKYLTAIEANRLNKLPTGVYGKNFIREYARFLGLDPVKVFEQFSIENGVNGQDTKNLFVQKVPGIKYFLSLPRLITSLFISAILLSCIIYLGSCVKTIVSPPTLAISNPSADITVDDNFINVQGITEPEAEVMINGVLVLTNPTGYFIKKVNLKTGLNTISITAKKKYGQKNIIEKKVLVKS
jgi:transcriptional regulator with XRE-family HTH domain